MVRILGAVLVGEYMRSSIVIGIGAVAAIVLIGAFIFWYAEAPRSQNTVTTTADLQALLNGNQAYLRAEAQLKAGNATAAYTLYQQALAAAKTPTDRGFIEDRTARSLVAAGNYIAAVPVYKGIADNASYVPLLRANALVQIVALFETYQDKNITSAVFSTDPYTSLAQNLPAWVPVPISTAYKNLALYSERFYPTAQAALDVALWDASRVANLKVSGSLAATSTAFISQSLSEIPQQIALAQADLPRLTGNPIYMLDLPEVYQHEAELSALLQTIGATSTVLADPESLYQKALGATTATASAGYPDYAVVFKSFTSYSYAVYLEKTYGSARTTQIQSLLANIYASPTPQPQNVTSFFTSPSALKAGGTRRQIRILISFDPKFGAYVKSLGWK